ncbi:MAG: hypothetical protein KC502_01520 [Myxococcales bacterium]|nr:hypothetical protein [Myxococcales bacterium]
MTKLSILVCLLALSVGCSRTPKAHNAGSLPPVPPPAASPAGVPESAPNPIAKGGAVMAQRSEFVATGKPAAPCRDCGKTDGGSTVPYHGKPQMKLDKKTLADVQRTVDATCALLESGVEILERNVKTPDKAATELKGYQDKNKQKITDVFHRADEVRSRLRVAGYDQDIPAEIRPAFNKRMGGIQKRLEKMRTVYAQHPDVLEAFGALFPRRH